MMATLGLDTLLFGSMHPQMENASLEWILLPSPPLAAARDRTSSTIERARDRTGRSVEEKKRTFCVKRRVQRRGNGFGTDQRVTCRLACGKHWQRRVNLESTHGLRLRWQEETEQVCTVRDNLQCSKCRPRARVGETGLHGPKCCTS